MPARPLNPYPPPAPTNRAARLRQLTVRDYLRQAAIPESAPAAPAQIDLTPSHVVIPTPRLNKEIIDAALYD